MAETNNEYRFDSVDLILYLWDRKWPIMGITTVAAIVSIIVALLIPVKFKSEVILFPAAASSVSHDLLSSNISKKEILRLGEDEEVEQLLQVLQSDEIRDRIIEKYDLMNHYQIDSTSKYPFTALHKEFSENISFTPTKFMSVRITVMDTDPKMAAGIANDISNLVDTIRNKMQTERAYEALHLVEKEYFTQRDQIQQLEDSLNVLRSFGVVDYESQAEVLTDAYGQAIIQGKNEAARKLEAKLNVLAKYGGAYVSIRDYLEFEKKQLSNLKAKYAEALVDATQNLPTKFVVNKAVEAEKKSYPTRWLIVVLSTFSAFILTVLLMVVSDTLLKRLKEIKKAKA
ncbi:MAG: Wzz/FepE/Etk N-terminal domain-containing protein [Salinivirgaceae bacterium]